MSNVQIEKIDMEKEMAAMANEILETDPRQDQFRAVKVLLIYQCQLLETMIGLLLKATEEEEETGNE